MSRGALTLRTGSWAGTWPQIGGGLTSGGSPTHWLRSEPLPSNDELNMMPKTNRAAAVGAGVALVVMLSALAAAPARGQDYPARPVKIVVPFPAGGTADVMPRIFADWLSRKLGQPFVVEDRAGAGGNIGAEVVAKSDPDGYTLLASPPPPLVINQNLYPHLPFDPAKFVPIVVMGRVPNALVVNPDKVKANTVPQFIAYLKANDGKVTDATQGNGTTSQLTAAMFQMMAKAKLQNVPYRGSAPALNDLVAGSVDAMFDNLGVSLQLVKAGKLKLIAVASKKRMTKLPDVPTIAETLPGFEAVAWFALVAPAGTPVAVVDKINASVNQALHDPEIRKRLADLSAEPVGGSPQDTVEYFQEETARWKNVITSAHVTLD